MKKLNYIRICCWLCAGLLMTAPAWAQTYSGILPCADCEGIETIITLNKKEGSYRMQEKYIGKSDIPFHTDGAYKIVNGLYVFYQEKSVKGIFAIQEKQMTMLDRQWRRITGVLAEKNVLRRTTLMTMNTAWQRKKNEGIDFTAFGNEPFWSLDIDAQSTVRFQTADLTVDAVVPYADYKAENGKMRYSLSSNGHMLDITLAPQYCSDGMSDNLYEYKVNIAHNGTAFAGCGAMIGKLPAPSPLPGKWELVFLSGPRIALKGLFPDQLPWLKFEAGEKRFSGSTGCNSMNGNFESKDELLKFMEPVAMTRRACADHGEATFLKMFKQVNRYRIEQEQLVLYNGNRVMMRLKSVD